MGDFRYLLDFVGMYLGRLRFMLSIDKLKSPPFVCIHRSSMVGMYYLIGLQVCICFVSFISAILKSELSVTFFLRLGSSHVKGQLGVPLTVPMVFTVLCSLGILGLINP